MRLPAVFLLILFMLTQAAAQAGQAGAQPSHAAATGPSHAADEIGALDKRVKELSDAKNYEVAAREAQAAVDAAARLFGEGSKEVSGQLSVLANIYLARHDTGKAKKSFARMLELREKRPGPSEQFEEDALERYTCLVAADGPNKSDRALSERISRVFIEDSVLAQGVSLSPDKKELQVGAAVSRPEPAYPAEAKMTLTSGSAVMLLSVGESGKVTNVTPLDCSSRAFVNAGVSAAYQATFKPTLVGGKPYKVRTIIFYRWMIF